MARALTTPPTNVRLLSDLYGNPVEEDKVARAIDGRLEVKAHGPRGGALPDRSERRATIGNLLIDVTNRRFWSSRGS